jgi:protein-L-isoaspartate(D-aspartate) O-methyltransferase
MVDRPLTALEAYRRFFAEELEAVCGLRTAELVEAFAAVPRERFLGPGPWLVKALDGDILSAPRETADADPRRIYHNMPVAIDAERRLFNGQPGTLGVWIDRLALEPGARVLHIGCGTGYYTALMARCVGAQGHVLAYEADEGLAARARENLADLGQVEVRHGTATEVDGAWNAVLVNAGTTHPLEAWLDAVAPGGRLVLPITFAFGGSPVGKGVVCLLTRHREGAGWDASLVSYVAIFNAVGVRDDALNARITAALQANAVPKLSRMRRDAHPAAATCWLHGPGFCLELGAAAAPAQ